MSDDLNTDIVFGADTSGVEAGMTRVKRSMADIGVTAERAGRQAGDGLSGIGKGGDAASRDVERATRQMASSIQRQIAVMQAGSRESREYWEIMANQRGVNVNALRPLLEQLDAAKSKTQELKAATLEMPAAWDQVGRAIGAAAGALAAAFSYRKFISETVAAEQEQTQLAAVLRSTGEAAGWTQEKLNAMAETLAKSSTFSAGEITQAQTRLLSYTGIVGTQFPRAMQNVIDMSARMGMDVKSAAETIGRALDIPSEGLTALQRQGFRFTDSQKALVEALEKTGRVGEAQAIILEAVESSYAGAAQAARDTFGGALSAVQNSINSLMTGEGNGLEAMRSALEEIVKVLDSPETRSAFQSFLGNVAELSAAGIKLLANFAAFRNSSNREAILSGTDEYGKMQGRVTELSERIELLTDRSERFREAISRGFNVEQNQRNLDRLRERIASLRTELVDATEALKAFANQQEPLPVGVTAKDFGLTLPEVKVTPPATVLTKEQEQAAKAAENAYKSLMATIAEKIALERQELESGEKLTESQRLRYKIEQEFAGARRATLVAMLDQLGLIEQQRKAAAEEAKAQQEAAKSYADMVEARQRSIDGIQAQIQRERDVAAAIGMTRQQISAMEVAKLEEAAADKERRANYLDSIDLSGKAGEAYRKEAKALRDLAAAKKTTAEKTEAAEVAKEAAEAAKKAAEEWKAYTDDINRSLTDALLRGFEDGKGFAENFRDTVKNMFSTLVLRPVISAVMTPVAGVVGSVLGTGSVAGGAGGLLSGLSNLSTLSTLSNMAGFGGIGSLLGGFGTAASYGTQALLAGNGLGAISGGWGMAAAGNIAQGLGMISGVLGPIALGIGAVFSLIKKFDDSGTLHTGAKAQYSETGGLQYGQHHHEFDINVGMVAGSAQTKEAVGTIAKGLVTTFDGLAKAFGKQAGYEVATAYADDTSKDGAWGALRVSVGGKELLNWDDTQRSRWAPKVFADGEEGYKQYLEAIAASTKDVLGSMNLPGWAQAMVDALGDTPGMDELAGAVAQIEAAALALGTVGSRMPHFAAFTDATVSALAKAAGGVDVLTSALSGYYGNFYTEAERTAQLTKEVREAMADLGLTMPNLSQGANAARAQFRAMLESINTNTERGREQYIGLLALQEAFASLTPVIDEAAEAARAASEAMQQREQLERQLLQLQGNTEELRRRQLAELANDQNRAIQQAIWDLQDTKAAEDAAAKIRATWQSVGNAIADEIKRLRGEIVGGGEGGLAFAEARFTVATAQARAGDQNAAAELPALSRALLELVEANAASSLDLRAYQAQIMASLTQTEKMLGQSQGIEVSGSPDTVTNQLEARALREAMQAQPVNPFAQQASVQDTRLEALVSQLVEENRKQAAEILRLNSRVTRLLERWDIDGLPAERVE